MTLADNPDVTLPVSREFRGFLRCVGLRGGDPAEREKGI